MVRGYRVMIWKWEFGRWQYYKERGQDIIVHIDNTKLGPRASQQERQCNWPTMTALIKAVQLQDSSMFQSHCGQKDSLYQVNWNQQQMDSWNSSKINTAIRMRHSRNSDQRAGWHLATSLGWVVCQTSYISPHSDPVSNPTCRIDFWNCSNYPLAASSGLQP